jgi:hypothetical protein
MATSSGNTKPLRTYTFAGSPKKRPSEGLDNRENDAPPKKKRRKKDPEPTDERGWRESWVPEEQQINISAVRKLYRLTDDDLAGLIVVEMKSKLCVPLDLVLLAVLESDMRIHSSYTDHLGKLVFPTMMMFDERQVELRAWRKHGGPEQFEAQ